MALEFGNTEIRADIFSRRIILFVFEKNVTEVNVASRCKAVSQTHTICNIGVCQIVCCSICWKV
jgi:hypothetical protein